MILWNWLIPSIFEIRAFTFWEAVGILALSKILFGGMHGGRKKHACCCGKHGRNGWKEKFKNKWANMSDKDKARWESKFGGSEFGGKMCEEKIEFEEE